MAEQGESDQKDKENSNSGHFSGKSEVPPDFDMKDFV
jgi:hypothetical protein